jgi:hypothetical protein
VSTAHLAPDHTELRAVLLRLALVDVRDLLTEVEVNILLVLKTLDLDQGSVGMLVRVRTTSRWNKYTRRTIMASAQPRLTACNPRTHPSRRDELADQQTRPFYYDCG